MSASQTNPEAVAATTTTETQSDFSALLNREFKPKSDKARDAVQSAVHTLARGQAWTSRAAPPPSGRRSTRPGSCTCATS